MIWRIAVRKAITRSLARLPSPKLPLSNELNTFLPDRPTSPGKQTLELETWLSERRLDHSVVSNLTIICWSVPTVKVWPLKCTHLMSLKRTNPTFNQIKYFLCKDQIKADKKIGRAGNDKEREREDRVWKKERVWELGLLECERTPPTVVVIYHQRCLPQPTLLFYQLLRFCVVGQNPLYCAHWERATSETKDPTPLFPS